jgi:hypothetical protein
MNEEHYKLLKEIINKVDPIGLVDFDTPESLDEYNSEVNEILKEDISHLNKQELSQRIREVFEEFFDKELAGSQDKYDLIADEFIAAKK